MDWFWESYAAGRHRVTCLRCRSSTRPTSPNTRRRSLVTNEHDLLRDQGEAYAAQLAEAGVDVTAFRALGMVHS